MLYKIYHSMSTIVEMNTIIIGVNLEQYMPTQDMNILQDVTVI